MIRLRPFRNDDPPAIADIWRSQPPQRSLVQPMTEVILDEMVLGKPYFDRQGLLLAESEGHVVGFAHATLGPADGTAQQVPRHGTISLVMVKPVERRYEIAEALLAGSEDYLQAKGANLIFGGELGRTAPFYLGLYGGSVPPGILLSDELQTQLYQQRAYAAHAHRLVLERQLVGFRPVVDREIRQFRRTYQLERSAAVTPESWWAACTWGQLDVVCYDLGGGEQRLARLAFWDIEPLASTWGVHAMGLLHWEVQPTSDRPGLLTYLLGESMRDMQAHGVTLVEVQADEQDDCFINACRRLGFKQIDEGIQYQRRLSGGPAEKQA